MSDRFEFSVTGGWLRDLASEPTPRDPWPCIRWHETLLEDQMRFLDVQSEIGIDCNLAWGFFIDRAWPLSFDQVIEASREEMLARFVEAAHERGIKVLSGVGIYSWGFDDIIASVPAVSAGDAHNMCAASAEAWNWQRRVLDFLMDPRWGLDGISMQSADQGRCNCERCAALSPAEYHANLLVRCAEYVRDQRPDWIIGQASWGLRVDEPSEMEHIKRISGAVDYMIEVRERSAEAGLRRQIAAELDCAFGSVGGVFVEPPQHWERLRWFVPCGLGSARALASLWRDAGRACEYFYRPFANPAEEVSWRTGARMLAAPDTMPEDALSDALAAVYGVSGDAREALADWYARGENAYFARADFEMGWGPLSLEPLIWKKNPAAPGPPVYLEHRMAAERRADYARELAELRAELDEIDVPNKGTVARTKAAIDGTLTDIATLQ